MKSSRVVAGILTLVTWALGSPSSAESLARIYIDHGSFGLHYSATQQLKVIGTDVMGNVVPVTEDITWYADPAVGTINQTGLFTAGSSTTRSLKGVTATTASGKRAYAIVDTANVTSGGYSFDKSWGGSLPGRMPMLGDVAVDSVGNVYTVDYSNFGIQKFDSDGNFICQWGTGTTDTLRCIAIKDNVLYVGCYSTLYKFDTSGMLLGTDSKMSRERNDKFNGISDIAIDDSGNMYVADLFNCRVQKLDSNFKLITKWGTEGTADGQFKRPGNLALDSAGNVYVVDLTNYNIQKFSSTGSFIARWTDIPRPISVDTDLNGNLYVADGSKLSTLYKLDTQGTVVSTIATEAERGKLAIDNTGNFYAVGSRNRAISKMNPEGHVLAKWGQPLLCDISRPRCIAVGPHGDLYFGNDSPHVIKKFDSSGDYVTQFGGELEKGCNWPWDVAVDSNDNVYGAFYGSVRKYNSTGSLLEIVDSNSDTPVVDVDSSDNLYIAASHSNDKTYTVRRISPAGKVLASWSTGYGGAALKQCQGLAVDKFNHVYYADFGRANILQFSSAGNLLSKWGIEGFKDGQLMSPNALATDSVGDVYIVDNSSKMKKFTSTGTYIGCIGTGNFGADIGCLRQPLGVAVDKAGNVFISDWDNNRVQKWVPTGASTPSDR